MVAAGGGIRGGSKGVGGYGVAIGLSHSSSEAAERGLWRIAGSMAAATERDREGGSGAQAIVYSKGQFSAVSARVCVILGSTSPL
jgi:hypothetical protein